MHEVTQTPDGLTGLAETLRTWLRKSYWLRDPRELTEALAEYDRARSGRANPTCTHCEGAGCPYCHGRGWTYYQSADPIQPGEGAKDRAAWVIETDCGGLMYLQIRNGGHLGLVANIDEAIQLARREDAENILSAADVMDTYWQTRRYSDRAFDKSNYRICEHEWPDVSRVSPVEGAKGEEGFAAWIRHEVDPLLSSGHMDSFAANELIARAKGRPATPAPSLDDRSAPVADVVLMPRALTAENGAKAALSGEFKFREAYGRQTEHTVPWTTIKEIYAKAVELLATPPAGAVQITDEMVEAALKTWYAGSHDFIGDKDRDEMRAALEAALTPSRAPGGGGR